MRRRDTILARSGRDAIVARAGPIGRGRGQAGRSAIRPTSELACLAARPDDDTR